MAQSLEDYIGTQISSFDVILLLKLVFVHSVLAAQKDVTEKKACLSCFILSSLFETSSSPDEDIFEEEELEFIYSYISPSEDKHLAGAHVACKQALPLKGLVTSQEKKSLQRSHSFFSSAHH